jgi:hypothetical protein
MNQKQIIRGLATTMGLVSTGLVSMGDNPTATQWVAVITSAVAAGLMAAIDSSKSVKEQFKKGETKS